MNLFNLRETSVANSRYFSRQNVIWRRRRTKQGTVFTTREKIDLSAVNVINSQQESKSFSSPILFLSILKVTDHLPDYENTAFELSNTVEIKLLSLLSEDMSLKTDEIALEVINTLKAFDTASYVKYASLKPELVTPKKTVCCDSLI